MLTTDDPSEFEKSIYDNIMSNSQPKNEFLDKWNKLTPKRVNTQYKSKNQTQLRKERIEYNNSGIIEKPEVSITSKHMCLECSTQMVFSNVDGSRCYICELCGLIEDIIGDNSEFDNTSTALFTGYNTSNKSSIPIKMTGPKASMYQKRIISSTAEYVNTQRRVTQNEMTKLTCFVENSRVPPHIVDKASNDYHTLQQHYIKRGDVRRGIMAFLVYEGCKESGFDRSPAEITEMFEITSNELSDGAKVIEQAKIDGILEITTTPGYNNELDMTSKIRRYFEMLNIPLKYMDFVKTLIEFTIAKRKKSRHSGMKARVTGAIFMLTEVLEVYLDEEIVNKSVISEKCKISVATFVRFSNIINELLHENTTNSKKLRHIYKKYGLTP
jgi:transcription initiation factor TFIIIB Brf1 subunit/transcription initiation factor TFIIB